MAWAMSRATMMVPLKRQTSRHGILVEFSKNFGHRAIEVNLHRFTLTSLAIFFGDEATGVVIEFFNPDTVFVDFALDVAVGRATHTETHRARSTVTRKANHTDVVGKVFPPKLRTKTDLASFFEQASFEFYVNGKHDLFHLQRWGENRKK